MALLAGALPGLVFTPAAQAVANADPDELWVTNGDVHTVVEAGGRVYLGGRFDQVGPNTGFGVPLDPATGVRTAAFPKVNGPVYVAVADGSGGWYIGGDFTRVGDRSRQNAARILADGTVGGWNPNTDFAVRAIALSRSPGANIAYIGGDFTVLRSSSTSTPVAAFGVAATNLFSGAPLWGLPAGSAGTVSTLALSPEGARLYVGGDFTALGGVSRRHLAALDAVTGAVDPAWNPAPDAPVRGLAHGPGGRIFAGGAFGRIGGATQAHLAALAPDGSADETWQPAADGRVNALVLTADGSRLYAAGDFSQVGGQSRRRLAALTTSGAGAVEPWGPGVNVEMRALALSAGGDRLYAGGGDDQDEPGFDGVPRRVLVAIDTTTGSFVDSFAPRPGAATFALAFSGPALYAGGQFTSVNGVARANLAALTSATGAVDPGFVANADGVVNAVVTDGSHVYAGGAFAKVNGMTRRRLVRVDAASGLVTPGWEATASAEVKSLVVAGPRLFVGGSFSSLGGEPRNRLGSLVAATAAVEAWNPDLDQAAQDLRLSPDQRSLYVVGDFAKVGATARQKLAAVDLSTGLATGWHPKPTVPITSVAVSSDGSLVYVATRGSRTSGNRLQAYHAVSGALAWERLGDGDFQAVAVSGALVYAGGHFTTVSGQVRGHLAAFDQTSGALQPWAPVISGVHGVLDLHVTSGAVYVAGEFDKVNGIVAQGIARFGNTDDPPPPSTTTTTVGPPPSTSTTVPPSTTTTQPSGSGPAHPGPTTTTAPAGPGGNPGLQAANTDSGYWMVDAGGSVHAFGDAGHLGNARLDGGAEAVDLEPSPTGRGYWIVDGRGRVSAFGDAAIHGHAAPAQLAPGEAVTSLSATPGGAGYWIFTSRGRVLAFGDAGFYGDLAATPLNGPVLDSVPTPSGAGYYMVASDGGVFTFGDARFAGSMGNRRLNAPVQSLVPDGDGSGYWLVASDGGIFAFSAPFRGSLGGVRLNRPVTGMVRFGDGYLMVGEDGGIFNFSNLPFHGSLGDRPPAHPVVSVAALGR